MKTIIYLFPVIIALSACGVKPDSLPGPDTQNAPEFPQTYPQEEKANNDSGAFQENPYR